MSAPFCSIGLASEIERAECNLLRSIAEAVTTRGRGRSMVMPLAGGVATWAGEGSPINKLAGLGFAGVPEAAALAAVEEAFDERRTPVQAELGSLADPAILATLVGRGYVLVGFENVLGRSLEPSAWSPAAGIAITQASAAERDDWLDAVVSGFCHPDDRGVASHETFSRSTLEGIMMDLVAAQGLRAYLAWRDGVAAGAASLRIDGRIAQLCGAATRPEHRRRGVQSALLAARLADAAAAGCELAVVTTQPGSTSQQNAERYGFRLLYCRAVLVRPPALAS